jgi:DNA-binding beta-propeller fold protein YncE
MIQIVASLALSLAPFVQEQAQPSTAVEEPYGKWLATIDGLQEPSAVAIDAEGRIWVAEAFADRVRAFDKSGKEVASIGKTGSGKGELCSPGGLAIAPDGSIFVADSGNHRIERFTSKGDVLATFGEWGWLRAAGLPQPALNEPLGLAIESNRLYVANARLHRVEVFSLDGEHLAMLGSRGVGDGQFERPTAVALDDKGFLYVADSGNNRIQSIDREGKFVRSWGEFGPWLNFFSDPTGIAWRDGLVYVADRDNHRVQVFGEDGELRYDFGMHALLPRQGEGKLHYPDHIALAPDGSFLALAESFEDRVQLFVRWPKGEVLEPDPLRFERDQSSHYGAGVSVGGNYMALVEPSAPSLILWDLELEEPVQVCRHRWFGHKAGQLGRPIDAAIDPVRNLVHVADPVNHRIASYSFTPRKEGDELKYDPFLLKLVRTVDLEQDRYTFREVPDGGAWICSEAWSEPDALLCVPNGPLLMADATSRTVEIFSPELKRKRDLPSSTEKVSKMLMRPVDLACDAKGERIYLVDQLGSCVVPIKLLKDDAMQLDWEHSIGGPEEERGGLVRPAGIEVLSDGRIWVTDMARHRIVEYGPDGQFRRAIGGPGLGRVQFHKPRGLAQDERGRVIVIDWGNHRGQILSTEGEYIESFGARFFTQPAREQKPQEATK